MTDAIRSTDEKVVSAVFVRSRTELSIVLIFAKQYMLIGTNTAAPSHAIGSLKLKPEKEAGVVGTVGNGDMLLSCRVVCCLLFVWVLGWLVVVVNRAKENSFFQWENRGGGGAGAEAAEKKNLKEL